MRRRQRGRQRGSESRALHKLTREGPLVGFQHCLPTGLSNDYSLANLLRIRKEFVEPYDGYCERMDATKRRGASRVAVSGFVQSLDQITRLLEFNREKVSGRDINPLRLNTRLISSAGGYFIYPESQTTRVSLAIEEVVIVLSYEILRIVDDVRGRLNRVVVDVNGDRRGRAKIDARGITKGDVERLGAFDERVIVDEHVETLRGLARCKAQGASGSDVIAALSGGAV